MASTVGRRAVYFLSFVSAAFCMVGYRYWTLQVQNSAHYQQMARADELRAIRIPAPRGNIVAADGVTVATSRPAWSVQYLNSSPMSAQELHLLASLLHTSSSRLATRLDRERQGQAPYQPLMVASNLSVKALTRIEDNLYRLPHLWIHPVPERYYPYGSLMGNILGYLGDITPAELRAWAHQGYTGSSVVGQAGLEAEYNRVLHGRAGTEYVEVNAQGQIVRKYGQIPPQPGDTLHLTINWRLEKTAQDALAYVMHAMRHAPKGMFSYDPRADRGAVIAMDPNNGDILAMASLPSYNPNRLLPGTPGRSTYFAKLEHSPLHPFLNRAIQGRYAPGSVFKPIMAVAALVSKVVTPTSKIYDPGYFPLIPSFHNWYAHGFGWLNIEQAIGLSDDVFFYTLGYRMGIQVMDHWMKIFLLNHRTHIDLPGEVRSIIPTPAVLEATRHLPWTPGWNLNTVIGQGLDAFTLIALARADSAIANGGTLYWPHLVSEITTAQGRVVQRIQPKVQGHVTAPAWVFQTVHKGMELSAQDPDIKKGVSGTGYGALAGLPIPVASKTGTAQRTGKPYNAFFLTYGPMPHPSILIIVYIHDGNWGADSGFVARAIYDQYFKIADPKARPLFDQVFGRPWPWPFSYTRQVHA